MATLTFKSALTPSYRRHFAVLITGDMMGFSVLSKKIWAAGMAATLTGLITHGCQEGSTEVAIFGAGIISSELPEFATTMSADGRRVFFNRTTADRSRIWIMTSELVDGVWSEPQELPFSNGDHLDVDPFIAPGGDRLYFSSDRPTARDSTREILNTWYVDFDQDGYGEPQVTNYPLSSDSTEIFVTMSDTRNAYFVSERDGNRGIKMSRYESGRYTEAVPVHLQLRGEPIYASNPCISADDSFLIAAARDPEGSGRPDLFVAFHEKGVWSELINLGPLVNTEYAEFAPGLSKDNMTLFFTSERPGIMPAVDKDIRPPGDIYSIELSHVFDQLDR